MEIDKIIALIQSVSESTLTGFVLEEGNMRLVLEKTSNSNKYSDSGQTIIKSLPNGALESDGPTSVFLAGSTHSGLDEMSGSTMSATLTAPTGTVVLSPASPAGTVVQPPPAVPIGTTMPSGAAVPSAVPVAMPLASAVPATMPSASTVQETPAIPDGRAIESPLVGTFYSAPSPDEPAFVKVGDSVKKGQVLGIIEAMKLMNEIESEFDGVVEAVLVQNEQMV